MAGPPQVRSKSRSIRQQRPIEASLVWERRTATGNRPDRTNDFDSCVWNELSRAIGKRPIGAAEVVTPEAIEIAVVAHRSAIGAGSRRPGLLVDGCPAIGRTSDC